MAAAHDNTLAQKWAAAHEHYNACVDEYDVAHSDLIEAEEAKEAAEEALLAVAAPSLEAVAIKLRAMWDVNMKVSQDPYVALQRQLIADVERLRAEKN